MKHLTRSTEWTLGVRLFVAQGLVLLAALATAGGVAAIIGPTLFHQHLIDSGHAPESPEIPHIEQAYFDASTASLTVAAFVATGCALAVTYYVTRRIRRPLETLSEAAKALSEGRYEQLPIDPEAGPEFRTVGAAFNDMSNRLQATEQTRLRLLGDLAHELRTPLANIKAHLEAVDDNVIEWNGETRAFVLAETDYLSRLAGDLNEVSRAEEGRVTIERHKQFLADIVADVIDNHRLKYESKGVSLRLDRGADAIVSVDATRIGQALNNLLNNALRHTPTGGLVLLSIVSGSKSTIQVHVTDNGEGVDADQLPHLFDRFYRGSSARGRDAAGSGIGLTIARALIEAHGGLLTASSAGAGEGATFTMSLPVAPPASDASVDKPAGAL